MQVTVDRWRATPWWRLFGSIFVLIFLVFAVWSVAVPLLSGPDEPAHLVKAAGVIRGEFVGKCGDNATDVHGVCPSNSPFTEVTVPAYYSIIRPGAIPAAKIAGHGVTCFAKHVDVPANCLILDLPPSWAGKSANAWIYVGRYPPLYYAIVGIPTLLGSGEWAVYLMRLVSAAVSALMLSCAVFAVLRYSRNRLLLLGMLIAATPMVFYLGGVVNPSGLETSSALAFWTLATVLVRENKGEATRSLVVLTTISALVLISIRALSPFWFALAVLSVLALGSWPTIKALALRRDIRIACLLVILVGAADVAWVLYEHSTNLDVASAHAQALIPSPSTSEWTILRTSFHHNIYYLPGMVGVFGAFDTYATHSTFVVWYALGGLALLFGLIAGRWRERFVLFAVAIGILIIPVLISSSQARRIGYVWSGRDTLPFAVGLPILCMAVIADRRISRVVRLGAPLVAAVAWFAQARAFFWVLRRYSVGEAGPRLSFLIHPAWSPPVIGCLGALAMEIVVLAAAYIALCLALGIGLGPFGLHRLRRNSDSQREKVPETFAVGE